MFTIPEVNVIASDEGFSVKVQGPYDLSYREGAKSLRAAIEWLAGPSGLVLYRDSIRRWDTPDGPTEIDEAERATIVDNIQRAFRFRNIEIETM